MWFFRVLMVQILEQKRRKAWEEVKATRGRQILKTVVRLFHVSSKSVSVRGENVEAVLHVLKYALKICTNDHFNLKCRLFLSILFWVYSAIL